MTKMMNLSQQVQARCLSSRYARKLSTKIDLEKTLKGDDNKPPNAQDFVKVRLTPGEGDPYAKLFKNRKEDPTFRPRWRHGKANVISKEDYQSRPKVVWDEQFYSLHDGMIVLSWLTEQQQQDVYSMYLQMMVEQEKEFKTTSHEYVMRVIAEKFNLSPSRVAAIVQNCHDEEQALKKGDPEMIHEAAHKYAEAKIQEHIRAVYYEYGEKNPNEFVEQPIGSAPMFEQSSSVARVDDLYDVDDLTKKAILREKDEAQLLIDQKVYVEDVDTGKISSKANAECNKLVKRANEEFKELREQFQRKENDIELALPDGGEIEDEEGNKVKPERRERWKFVAKTINVRENRKLGKKSRRGGKMHKKYQKDNTIVEHNGKLRVATVEEVNGTPWRPLQNDQEQTYKGVKAAWLNRTLKGETDAWGRMKDNRPVEDEKPAEDADADASNGEENAAKASEGNESKDEK